MRYAEYKLCRKTRKAYTLLWKVFDLNLSNYLYYNLNIRIYKVSLVHDTYARANLILNKHTYVYIYIHTHKISKISISYLHRVLLSKEKNTHVILRSPWDFHEICLLLGRKS